MKFEKYGLLTRILLIVLLIMLISMVCAEADQIIIVPVSDDRMSALDEDGAMLRTTVEAFTYALELKGDNVLVLGSVKKTTNPVYVYSHETGGFQWENGEDGLNNNYIKFTLAQLKKIDVPYDKAIILSGHLQASQNPNREVFDNNIQFFLYRTQELAKNSSLVDLFGNKLKKTAEEDSFGFVQFGNVMAKETGEFDSLTAFKDLLGETYSGAIRVSNDSGLIIPEKISTNNTLVIVGSGIRQANIIIDGERIIKVTSEASEKKNDVWYSPLFTFGNKEMLIIPVPEGTTGSMKISGVEDAEAYLYYVENQQLNELINQEQLCPEGLQYGENDSVRISLSDSQLIRELRLLYPDSSFQASFTPIDASAPFSIYENEEHEIVWNDINSVKTQILVSLKESKDGKDIITSDEYIYIPISELIDTLEMNAIITPDGTVSKRGKGEITLSIKKDSAEEKNMERAARWLSQAVATLKREDNSEQEKMLYDPDYSAFRQSIEFPDHKGSYQWEIILSSGEGYPISYSKSCVSESIQIENHSPVCNESLVEEKEITRLTQPGAVAKIVVPKDLFTDPDFDPLVVSYVIYKDSAIYANGSYEGKGGSSPEQEITDIHDFGDWTIELTAVDNDDASSQSIILKVHNENGNSAPIINEELLPIAEETIPLLRLSDYVLKIPRGLFSDNEGDDLIIEGSLNYDSGDYVPFSFNSQGGVSDTWEITLERFGTCTIQLKARDQYDLESETVTFKVQLEDALASLPGTLSSIPEKPQKGENTRIRLTLNWPEEYSSLNIREWLENSNAILADNNNTQYEMHLSNSEMVFETDVIQMPDQKTDLVYTVVVAANEGNMPQKRFVDYQPLSISIDNSAPRIVAEALENQTKYCLDPSDYVLQIPKKLFVDNEEDDFAITLSIVDANNETKDEQTFGKDETPEIKMPGFGKWTVRLTAKDTENLVSESFEYCTVTLHNLKMIIIIAAAGLILIIAAVTTILIIRYRKKLPRFHQVNVIQFKLNEEAVSKDIHMPEGSNQQAIPLSTFAIMITTLLSDTQWNNLKQWSVCPTHDEKPVFRKNGTKAGGDQKIELGEGLTVEISNE